MRKNEQVKFTFFTPVTNLAVLTVYLIYLQCLSLNILTSHAQIHKLVRGGPTLTFFIIGSLWKRHLNGVSLA